MNIFALIVKLIFYALHGNCKYAGHCKETPSTFLVFKAYY